MGFLRMPRNPTTRQVSTKARGRREGAARARHLSSCCAQVRNELDECFIEVTGATEET